MRIPMKLNELLETTEHKRMKEYMRTDKPSRRRLYMEIYEFKDKTVINKLPTTKEKKTDCPKTIKIEYDCVTKDIIRVKLSDLQRSLISFMRLKEYESKFGKTKEVVEDVLHSGIFNTYETVLPTLVHEAPERYFLIVERNGAIHGWIGICWRTQLHEDNSVKAFGGDVVSIGVSSRILPDAALAEVLNVIRKMHEDATFKDMVTLRLPKKYGDVHLVHHSDTWIRYPYSTDSTGCSWTPRALYAQLIGSGNVAVTAFYSCPPRKKFSTVTEMVGWIAQFKENYKRRWSDSHIGEMSATEEAELNTLANAEAENERVRNQREIRDWAERVHEILNAGEHGLVQMSHCATLLGLNRNHRENNGEDDEDSNSDDEGSCGDGCERLGTDYCSNECGGDPCHNCREDCGNCPRGN